MNVFVGNVTRFFTELEMEVAHAVFPQTPTAPQILLDVGYFSDGASQPLDGGSGR